MRAIRSGFGFGCRRGGGRIGQVILVGKHGCWPPEITSLTVAVTRPRVPSNRFLADSLSGFSARRLTAKRLLGTQMLRASKTLQPQKDTRRLNPLSMNPQSGGARQQGGAFEKRRDFLLFLQYYILQEDQAWTISHLQSLRALHI